MFTRSLKATRFIPSTVQNEVQPVISFLRSGERRLSPELSKAKICAVHFCVWEGNVIFEKNALILCS
jgi:hypothetical protein